MTGDGRPAVVVHTVAQARAAIAAAGPRGVLLLSAPAAAATLGAAWFLAVAAAAGAAPDDVALDCGDTPGLALGALRAGARVLVLAEDVAAFAQVAGAAAAVGATVWPTRPVALDLGGMDLRREAARARLGAWLGTDQPQP